MTDNKIEITRIGAETLAIPIRGTAPLIVHRFAEKAKATMLDAMQGRRTPRTPKDPEAGSRTAPATGSPPSRSRPQRWVPPGSTARTSP
jgi:hypothetical protein